MDRYDGIRKALGNKLKDEIIDLYMEEFDIDFMGYYADLLDDIALFYMLDNYKYDVSKGNYTIKWHNAIYALLDYFDIDAPKPEKLTPYTVYKRIGPEGKVYIGLTSKTPEERANDGQGYEDNPKILVDILKYGWKSFKTEIIADNLLPEEADRIETEKIAEYDAVRRGYNRDAKV